MGAHQDDDAVDVELELDNLAQPVTYAAVASGSADFRQRAVRALRAAQVSERRVAKTHTTIQMRRIYNERADALTYAADLIEKLVGLDTD